MLKSFYRLAVMALIAAIAPTFTACSDDDSDSGSTSAKINHVTITSDPNNALRYPVTVNTSDNCIVSVSYWPTATPTAKNETKAVTTTAGQADLKIMFVKPQTDYSFQVNINGRPSGDVYTFTTGELPPAVPTFTVAESNEGAPTEGYLMVLQSAKAGYITFNDMDGAVVWYEKFDQAIRCATYDPVLKKMCVLTGFREGSNSVMQRLCDKIIVLDLEGNRYLEWVASADNVAYPHHDIKFLPTGDLILVNNVLKNFDLSSLGLSNNADVWGDGFTIIGTDGTVKRTWDNWDALTPFQAVDRIKEQGAIKDFLHANSVNWDSDGNFYMTFNRLNQLWKIDGRTGEVLYRVGPDGDVQLDASGYTDGIHAAVPLARDKVLVYDNGSERGYSRALVYEINPTAKTARVTLNVAIPQEYSSTDRSNVQLIKNGKMLMFGNTTGRSAVFTDLQGNILKVITRNGISYRTHFFEPSELR